MSFESAERVQGADGRQYHIGLAPGEVAPWIVLVGDPARAERIATRFDQRRLERRQREYVSFTGVHRGLPMTVMATGMGPDNTEIAVIELLNCERHPTILRVGSCGALQPQIGLGEMVITQAGYRIENTSLGFVDPGYPAIAHHELVLALLTAARASGHPHHLGITATASGFYGWQGRKGQVVEPLHPDLPDRLGAQGVLNFEMETTALLTLASRAGIRAGAICAVFANRPANRFIDPEDKVPAEDRAIAVGLEALHRLAELDGQRGADPHWTPDHPA